MTVWLLCFAALVSNEQEVMTAPSVAELVTPETAFVRIAEAPKEGLICAPYSEDGHSVMLTIMVDAPKHARMIP